MSKHPLDHGHAGSAQRAKRYAEAERANRPSRAAKILQQRAKPGGTKPSGDGRLLRFLTIERRAEA
ncbi:hypothetical protein [Pararhodobacter oceanensis]|uniref:Uncharacterized protein n=1 Tax=Pararhodobacter oceanensis TaxID=2172121 RepID=A0A2T8HR22_9RHOB|nr:hypothetical protein [Pararhodobacter oceanensis]PVH27899.1 hypothetical protein DDE20_15440 [Pararhodobacter oceanensis]